MNTEQDFAAFEAQANSGETVEQVETQPEPEAPLELTDGDEASDVPEGEEGGEEHTDEEGRKRRSKPASQRIAEITAKLRAAERKIDELTKPVNDDEAEAPVEPKSEDYEFGEADPAYIKALIQHERAAAKHEAREEAKAENAKAQQQAWQDRISSGVEKAQAEAQAKYEDFDAKIASAVEARGGEAMPAMVTVAIGMSPAGGDILYRLAGDKEASDRLESLAKAGQIRNMAMAFGELEGEYLEDTSDSDLNINDPEDMARMLGRMRGRLKSPQKPAEGKKPSVAVTNAPEPPKHTARGAGGQFQVDASTSDFAAFEKLANRK